jgi:raffinose/stachyose/melibiose transport system permease protein
VFVGLQNYIGALQDADFWAAMWVTVKYVLGTVFFSNILGFGLAYLVTSGVKGQNFFRTALFTPNLIGGLILGYIWQFVFVTSLPILGQQYNIDFLKLGWLGDEKLAFWALVIVTVWQQAGYMMIIFIAGIMNVPKDIIEASTIDGANGFQRLIHMTLPMMIPSFVVTVFLTLKGAFMVYDINYALTQGGPYGSTKMASMHVVGLAFSQNEFGLGQAEAIVLFAVVAVATGLQVYFSKRLEVEA